MREEVTWRWRVQWCGKWKTSSFQATEDDIRKEHPEATRIEGTKRVQMVPETQEEMAEIARLNSTSAWQRKG